jgi:glutamate formiminotransferase
VAISPYTNMVELSTQVDNQDLSTNPQKTKLFIFVTKTDILDVDVKNKIVSKLRNTGGIVSVINARTDLDNINFVTIVNSLQFLLNVENFNELPAYRFLERKFCIGNKPILYNFLT